jgi:hypothetical protein
MTFSVPKFAGNGCTAANADALSKKPTDAAAAKFRIVKLPSKFPDRGLP